MNARREASAVFIGALVAALLLLLSVAGQWASGHGLRGLIPDNRHTSGRTVAPLVAAAGLVALAGAAAIPATRKYGRTVTGIILAVSGVAAAAEALIRRNTAQDDLRKVLPSGSEISSSGWPYVAFVGALLLVAVGVAMALRGARWASLSARYEAPTSHQKASGDIGAWDALDRGEDPTEGEPHK